MARALTAVVAGNGDISNDHSASRHNTEIRGSVMNAFFRALFRRKIKPSSTPHRQRIDLGQAHPPYTIYAVGDVHGCLVELRRAEQRILADIAQERRPGLLILLGDYVDRGPQSAGVLDYLGAASNGGLRRLALCGNHDSAFLKFIRTPQTSMEWLEYGGKETLLSYGINSEQILQRRRGKAVLKEAVSRLVPSAHITFLENLPISVRIANFLFVHAGIRPGVPIEEQVDEDFLWIREPFLTEGPKLPFTVVHGHTVAYEPVFSEGRIGIDTAAYMTGRLSVLKIINGRANILE